MGFPSIYWECFLKYNRMLMWADVDECKRSNWKVSYAELALDFELATGQKLEDPGDAHNTTWARKAEIMNLMYKLFFKVAPNHDLAEWPRERFPALSAFGLRDEIQGLGRRPKFIKGKQTEELIAHNALKILSLKGDSTPNARDPLWRLGPLRLTVDYTGFRMTPVISNPNNSRREDVLAACRNANAAYHGPLQPPTPSKTRYRIRGETTVFTKRHRLRTKVDPRLGTS